MFSVFSLKNPSGIWSLCPEADIKIDRQHAVKNVLDVAEKWKTPKFRSKF